MSPLRRFAARAARWRALLDLLAAAGRGRLAAFAALVLAAGLLPTVVILATGAFVRAIPAVAGHGLGGPEARPAVLAFSVLALALAGRALCAAAAPQRARVLAAGVALAAQRRRAAVTARTPGR